MTAVVWESVEPRVVSGGDVGGDIQTSESWSVRFALPRLASGFYALIDANAYVATRDPMGSREAGLFVQVQVERLICADPSDPGGTEQWSEYEYRTVGRDYSAAELEEATFAARQAAEEFHPTSVGWDAQEWAVSEAPPTPR